MASILLTCVFLSANPTDVSPSVSRIEAGTSVWDVAARDITGDGRADLFLLCCDETAHPLRKFVAVHVADALGGYPLEPSCQVSLDAVASVLFFAETDGAFPPELVAAHAEGAQVFRLAEAGPSLVSEEPFSTLLPSGSKEPVFLDKMAYDLDGDGIDEWLIPVPSAYELRKPSGRICRIPCDTSSEIHRENSVYIMHRLPACHVFDLEGRRAKALAFLSDEFADFAYGEDWTKRVRFEIPLTLEDKWEAAARMEDIDASGFPDLVVTQMKGTVNLRVVTHVYLASGAFEYPETPNAAFETKGALASPALHDVDNDGKQDLIVVSVPFGVKNIVNYFVRGKVSAHIDVYLYRDGGFDKTPTYSDSLTLDAPEGRERVAYAVGDFNGDGRIDVVVGAGPDRIAIHAGGGNRFISARPWTTLDLPSFGVARASKLNDNDSDDLILYHPAGSRRRNVEVVVF